MALGLGLGLGADRGAGSAPVLSLDFLNDAALDSRITFTRGSSATRVNSSGLIESVSSNVARFDYDPVTLAAKGLLIEEARTNLLTYSSDWTNAAWNKTNITVTAAATTSPDGSVNAQKLAATATALTNLLASATATGTSATYSVYVKQGTGPTTANTFALRNNTTTTNLIIGTLNYATGVWTYSTGSTGVTVTNAGNGWWRVQITANTGITAGDSLITYCGFIGPSQTAGDFLYAYGAQLEAGAFATSHIPTSSSTVTRSADVATMTGTNFSSWYNQSAGTFVVQADVIGPATDSAVLSVDAGGTTQFMLIPRSQGQGTSDRIYTTALQANLSGFTSITYNSPFKHGFAFANNDFAGALNGSTPITASSGSLPTVDTLRFGRSNTAGTNMSCHIRTLAYYNTRLPNAALQSLTA